MASAAGSLLPAFDVGFTAALDRLRNLPGPWHDVSTWMGRQTNGLAYTMGRDLAQAIQDGLSRSAMLDIIHGVMTEAANAEIILDYAISDASSRGSLDTYRSAGVEWVAILVSPDACTECDGLDAEPYLVGTEPYIPRHPRCRCGYSPVVRDPSQAYG
jgi:hypothetical protein